ncbi:helix-turn-helix domain-containing protein [Embleya sp. NPDC001921]
MFRDEPETVASTIRRRRLEHCREEPADPSLAGRTIGEIAARWGFRSSADSSRAFRHAYGISPSQARLRAEPSPAQVYASGTAALSAKAAPVGSNSPGPEPDPPE